MPAYIIADIEIHDASKFEEYRKAAPSSIRAYGGRYIVRGGKVELLEGQWSPQRLVILEFSSLDQAKAWWNSDEYAEAKLLRQASTQSQFIVAAGTEDA